MNIDGKTKLLGLIGTPVEHSKSPAMYNYCFDKYGLNCAYLAFDVDMDHVADAVAALRTFHVMGCNVTMPLKNAVIPYLDEVSPASRAIGSVNTIVNKDGKLYGYVTDGMGYTGELRRGGVEVAGKVITLLGAGGAASAIAIEAALEGAKPVVEYMDGWKCDISHARQWTDLPLEARRYVRRIEQETGCPIRYVSVGAGRDEYIKL